MAILYLESEQKGQADNCIAAEADGRVVGAVWTGIMNDYGRLDDKTPSFAISLYDVNTGDIKAHNFYNYLLIGSVM